MTEVAQIAEGTPVDQINLKGVSRAIKVYEIHPRTAPVRASRVT